MDKRGQPSGSSAASLVLFILLIIIFYILFLPPDDRKELLDKEVEVRGSGASAKSDYNNTLLQVHVGRIDFVSRTAFEHNVPSVYLVSSTGGQTIKSINPFYIKNGVFDEQSKEVTFAVSDIPNTNNVLLSFAAKVHTGRLVIHLNGEQIFESDIGQFTVDPVELPKELLAEENTLMFSVSSVGAAFWRTNEYDLTSVKVTGDITDVSGQESRNVFQMSGTEKFNLDNAYLRFVPDCVQSEVGRLDVLVNGHNVFSGIPDCGSLSRKITIDGVFLNSGENSVTFRTSKGTYLIDQVRVNTQLKDTKSVTQFFLANQTDIDFFVPGKKNLFLQVDFVDDNERKEGVLDLNGKCKYSFNQLSPVFKTQIRNDLECIKKGSNYLDIQPEATLSIVEAKIFFEDK
ncbi:MAG TPA: hypothetical protein VJC16_03095 [Candidatus Nanoarchaeia archaeon]|nr:hypothetical protein [Candidatus Nanoarchaeia archaeon]